MPEAVRRLENFVFTLMRSSVFWQQNTSVENDVFGASQHYLLGLDMRLFFDDGQVGNFSYDRSEFAWISLGFGLHERTSAVSFADHSLSNR
jgi:hypothetical protein